MNETTQLYLGAGLFLVLMLGSVLTGYVGFEQSNNPVIQDTAYYANGDLTRNITIDWRGIRYLNLTQFLIQYAGFDNNTIQKMYPITCCLEIWSNDTMLSVKNDSQMITYHLRITGNMSFDSPWPLSQPISYFHVIDYTWAVPLSTVNSASLDKNILDNLTGGYCESHSCP